MQTLKERRRKINGRLVRKYSTIEDLLFSCRNAVIVEEELCQFNDLFKMLLSVHEECSGLLHEEERHQDNEWFDEIDAQAFSFKRKIHAWLREVSEKQSSRSYSKGSRSSSGKSGRSKSLKGSKSSGKQNHQKRKILKIKTK